MSKITRGTPTSGPGSGDVVGPASSTDNAVARWDGTTGELLQDSVVIVSDAGLMSGVTQLNVGDSPPANPYDITIEDSIDGLIGMSIQNTSVGVSAGVNVQLIVEPGTGDSFVIHSVNGAQTFSVGIDNSDSDTYKITTGSTPSSGTSALEITSAGVVTLPAAPLDVPSGGTGVTSATAYAVLCGGTTAAGPFQSVASVGTSGQVLTSNGAGALPTFEDASSGDVSGPVSSTDNALSRWDGVNGDTLQDSTVIVSDNGEMTNASQPSFLAYNSADDANQTGNGAIVTVPFDTEVFDRGGNFASNTFTAPITGLYEFNICVRFEQLTAAMTNLNLNLVTSNRTYQFDGNPGVSKSSVDQYTATFSVLADMDATDTASVTTAISGGAGDTAGISGASTLVTYFSGHLVA